MHLFVDGVYVVALPPGSDPAPYAAVGATWWLADFPWVPRLGRQVRGVIRDHTPTPHPPGWTTRD